jgi:hypothetical protein
MARTLIAKLKFWFGQDIKDLFNSAKYEIEETPDGFVYIYLKTS